MSRTHSTALRIAVVLAAQLSLAACSDNVGPGTAGEIAFQLSDGVQFDIYSVRFTGRSVSPVVNLTSTPAPFDEGPPAWSPDGSKIAFSCGAGPELCTANADGTNAQQLTDTVGANFLYPNWSPDASTIALVLCSGASPCPLYTIRADGSDLAFLVVPPAPARGLAWSPDGSRIAFTADDTGFDTEVYIVNADGSGLTNISNNPNGADREPAWSPDGSQIAFYSYRGGVGGIHTMNPDGTGVRPLMVGPGGNLHPNWAPDGARLAFVSTRDGSWDLYVANVDGTGVLRLTNDSLTEVDPRWRPSP